jgi:hypothetical protein
MVERLYAVVRESEYRREGLRGLKVVLRINLGRDCSVEGGSGRRFKETPYL